MITAFHLTHCAMEETTVAITVMNVDVVRCYSVA